MTANQIAYQKLQEERRANYAKEGETHRSNKANEAQRHLDYVETWRANLAREKENTRSNMVKESQDWNKHTDTLLENRRQFDQKLAYDHAHHLDDVNTARGATLIKAATDIGGSALGLLGRQGTRLGTGIQPYEGKYTLQGILKSRK